MTKGLWASKTWRDSHREYLRASTKAYRDSHKDYYDNQIKARQRYISKKVAAIRPSSDPESLFYVPKED